MSCNQFHLTKHSRCSPCHHLSDNVLCDVTPVGGDSGWFRGRDRVTEPLAWLMASDWTASAVKSPTCTLSMSNVYRSVG